MKKHFTLLTLLSFLFTTAWSQLSPQETASIFDHLQTVNQEWIKQTDLDKEFLALPIKFKTDEERIQLHLQLVEMTLRHRTTDLSAQQYANRTAQLDVLAKYWKRALFPQNTGHVQRQPYFIDNYGTACAVGHLLQESGANSFAEKVRVDNNFAYIHEMNYEELPIWSTENGLSIDELAWIQPGYIYCDEHLPMPGFTAQSGSVEVIEFVPGYGTIIAGNFTNALGNNILGFDGVNLQSLDAGAKIDGTIYTVESYNGDLYIGGEFSFNGVPANIAKYDGTVWSTAGNFDGRVNALKSYECRLYAGGEFQNQGGISASYLCAYDGAIWSIFPSNCANSSAAGILSANDPVNTFEVVGAQLLVGGQFTTVFNVPAKALAVWQGGWVSSPISNGAISLVDDLLLFENNYVYVSADGLSVFDINNGTWHYAGDSNPASFGQTIPVIGRTKALTNYDSEYTIAYAAGNSTYILNGATPVSIGTKMLPMTYNNKVNAIYAGNTPLVGGEFDLAMSDQSNQHSNCPTFSPLQINKLGIFRTVFEVFFPVELSRFEASLRSSYNVVLDWTTETETNVSHFEIERREGVSGEFEMVGELSAEGESISQMAYVFDDDISRVNSTKLYYRLKIVDNDNEFHYSDTRLVKSESKSESLSLMPNPTKGSVRIQVGVRTGGDATIELHNLQGQLLLEKRVETTDDSLLSETFEIGDLAPGIYLISVTTMAGRKVRKLELID